MKLTTRHLIRGRGQHRAPRLPGQLAAQRFVHWVTRFFHLRVEHRRELQPAAEAARLRVSMGALRHVLDHPAFHCDFIG